MTKTEFLQQLYNHLQPLSPDERDEVIQDFEEHFSVGLEIGKTEEQICQELGNPYTCALQYLRQNPSQSEPQQQINVNKAQESSKSNSAKSAYNVKTDTVNAYEKRNRFLWGLMFFFFIFCAMGVYPTSIALMVSPIAVAVGGAFAFAVIPSGAMIGFFISLSIAMFCVGLLMFLIMTWLLKTCFKRSGL